MLGIVRTMYLVFAAVLLGVASLLIGAAFLYILKEITGDWVRNWKRRHDR